MISFIVTIIRSSDPLGVADVHVLSPSGSIETRHIIGLPHTDELDKPDYSSNLVRRMFPGFKGSIHGDVELLSITNHTDAGVSVWRVDVEA